MVEFTKFCFKASPLFTRCLTVNDKTSGHPGIFVFGSILNRKYNLEIKIGRAAAEIFKGDRGRGHNRL
jgi:hypothetical protein